MSYAPHGRTVPFVLFSILLSSLLAGMPKTAGASDVSCQFKAATDKTEIDVVANGKTLWTGSIEKSHTQTVSIPEGPFTVISKVYNENLKTKGDVRADSHTRQCRNNAVLSVPLFEDPNKG
jgi:hypothetical protein